MEFYYISRITSNEQIEYYEGILLRGVHNHPYVRWSAHWMGSGHMNVAFSKKPDGFNDVLNAYPSEFKDATVKCIDIKE